MILTDPIPPITSHSSSPQLYESASTRHAEQHQEEFEEIYAFLTGTSHNQPGISGSLEACQGSCDSAQSGLPDLSHLQTESVLNETLSPQATVNAEVPDQPFSTSGKLPLTLPLPNDESLHTLPSDSTAELAIPLDDIELSLFESFSDDIAIRPTHEARHNLAGRELTGRESMEATGDELLTVVESHFLHPLESASTDSTILQLMTPSAFSENSSPTAVPTQPVVVTTSDVAQQVLDQSLPHIIAGNGNDETLTIRLDPPELGEVLVRIQKSEGGIAIRVAAMEQSTQLFLEQHADDLSEFMSTNNEGLTMELEKNHDFQDSSGQPWDHQGRHHFPPPQQRWNIQEGTDFTPSPHFINTAEDFFA